MPKLPTLSLPGRKPGRPRSTPPEIRRTVVISDLHCPELDPAAFGAALSFIKDTRPDFLFLNGDIVDFYEISSFDKDPKRFGQTAEELEMANDVLDQLYNASPTTITRVLYGNHEHRLTRKLYEVPEILPFFTKSLDPNEIIARSLNLEERSIEWFPYKTIYNHHGFAITHGEGGGGANPARKNLL